MSRVFVCHFKSKLALNQSSHFKWHSPLRLNRNLRAPEASSSTTTLELHRLAGLAPYEITKHLNGDLRFLPLGNMFHVATIPKELVSQAMQAGKEHLQFQHKAACSKQRRKAQSEPLPSSPPHRLQLGQGIWSDISARWMHGTMRT